MIVIGGGVSGLAAACVLQDKGIDYVLLEGSPSLGGLTRTIKIDRFCFDYTGHLLHLAYYPSPGKIPFANMDDRNWERITRRAFCLVGGKLIPAPIQYNISQIPQPLRKECIDSYNSRPSKKSARNLSFREYVVSNFGEKLANLFIIPQNEKTQAIDTDQLSPDAMRRFFSPPDDEKIRLGIKGGALQTMAYNSTFWYPRTGGIEEIVQGLSKNLNNIILNEEAIEIDLDRRIVTTRNGRKWGFENLISSIPLKDLCLFTGDPVLIGYAREMTNSTTIVYNFGITGTLSSLLKDIHWIYIPDRDIPFYRVGAYSNMFPGMASTGYASLYVEVGVSCDDLKRIDINGKLYSDVILNLERLGWIRHNSIECCIIHVIRCAYVHHTLNWSQYVPQAIERLVSFNVYPIGRYGLWDYTSMEDSIRSGIDTIEKIL